MGITRFSKLAKIAKSFVVNSTHKFVFMKATALNSLFEDFLETNRFILVVCAFLMDPLFAEYVHITNNLLFVTIEWNERGKGHMRIPLHL